MTAHHQVYLCHLLGYLLILSVSWVSQGDQNVHTLTLQAFSLRSDVRDLIQDFQIFCVWTGL